MSCSFFTKHQCTLGYWPTTESDQQRRIMAISTDYRHDDPEFPKQHPPPLKLWSFGGIEICVLLCIKLNDPSKCTFFDQSSAPLLQSGDITDSQVIRSTLEDTFRPISNLSSEYSYVNIHFCQRYRRAGHCYSPIAHQLGPPRQLAQPRVSSTFNQSWKWPTVVYFWQFSFAAVREAA